MVPTGNLIMMAVNALLGIAIPIFLCWWAVKKHQANLSTILIGAGVIVCFVIWYLIRRGVLCKVQGTSIAGAVAHNIGQVIAAWFVVRTPMLLTTYLPVLIGAGILVGCMTGIVTERVMKALRMKTE
jgi:uncharacterized membrane protein